MDWPTAPVLPRHTGTICTVSLASLGGVHFGGTYASAAWVAANRALYIPFRVSEPLIVKQLFVHNGATASGNLDVGIYDAKGTRLVSSGSTAQAGTSVLQVFDITDTQLGAGVFYLAAAMDGVTGTIIRTAPAPQDTAAVGVVQQATAFPLPATATFAALASGFMPLFGLTTRTVI